MLSPVNTYSKSVAVVNRCHCFPSCCVVMHMYVAFSSTGAKERRLIPVLIEEAYRYKIPRTISHITYLDWLRREEKNFWNSLAESLGWKSKWVPCCNWREVLSLFFRRLWHAQGNVLRELAPGESTVCVGWFSMVFQKLSVSMKNIMKLINYRQARINVLSKSKCFY